MLSSELQLSDISVSSEIQTSLSFASFSFLCQSGLRVAHLRTLKLMKNQSGSQKEKVRIKLRMFLIDNNSLCYISRINSW